MTLTAVVVPDLDAWIHRVEDGLPMGLTPAETRSLFWAMVADVVSAATDSGGPMVVYDEAETIAGATATPAWVTRDFDVYGPIELNQDDLFAELAAMTDEASVALVKAVCPLLARRHIDAGAMRLRRHDVVVGTSQIADWYYLGTTSEAASDITPTDSVTDVIRSAVDRGRSVDFLPMLPVGIDAASMADVLRLVRLHAVAQTAGAPVTRATLEEFGSLTNETDTT